MDQETARIRHTLFQLKKRLSNKQTQLKKGKGKGKAEGICCILQDPARGALGRDCVSRGLTILQAICGFESE
jgi:hypothetical protein